MTYREAAIYANKHPREIKEEFENILEAFEEANLPHKLTKELIDFWLHGSIIINYEMILKRLKAKDILLSIGLPQKSLSTILSTHATIDHYLLLKNICLNRVFEEFTSDFQTLVLEPINKLYIEPSIKFENAKLIEIEKANKVITSLSKPIQDSINKLDKLNKSALAGTVQETLLIEFTKLDELISDRIK